VREEAVTFREIKLTHGFAAIVDIDDHDRLSKIKWYAHKSHDGIVYARSGPHGFMHHHVLPPKSGFIPDHIDGNGLNNCKSNLRYLTQSQNKLNGRPYRLEDKTSRYRGVSKRQTGWMARITFRRKTKSLGVFRTELEAAQRYETVRALLVSGGQL
jgi:hypothetical protein